MLVLTGLAVRRLPISARRQEDPRRQVRRRGYSAPGKFPAAAESAGTKSPASGASFIALVAPAVAQEMGPYRILPVKFRRREGIQWSLGLDDDDQAAV